MIEVKKGGLCISLVVLSTTKLERDSWVNSSYNGVRRPFLTLFLRLWDDVRTGVTIFITEIRKHRGQMMWLVVFYNDTKNTDWSKILV